MQKETGDSRTGEQRAAGTAPGAGAPEREVKLDTSQLKSSYCNICNATSTREEVVLNFGVNQNWDLQGGGGGLDVSLQHRIILSPFAAKRLQDILSKLMGEYEGRYGALR